MVNVYKEIEKCILPDEYLPDDYNGPSAGPESKIIGKMYVHNQRKESIYIPKFMPQVNI